VDDLALQVGVIDDVVIDDADAADPGGGQVEQQRRTEAAGTDAEDFCRLQALLTFDSHFRQNQVPGVAGVVVLGQLDVAGVDVEHRTREQDP
jgi:hypothetical protein